MVCLGRARNDTTAATTRTAAMADKVIAIPCCSQNDGGISVLGGFNGGILSSNSAFVSAARTVEANGRRAIIAITPNSTIQFRQTASGRRQHPVKFQNPNLKLTKA